jgi:hypothetical protein
LDSTFARLPICRQFTERVDHTCLRLRVPADMMAEETQNTGTCSATLQNVVFQNLALRIGQASHTRGIFDIMTPAQGRSSVWLEQRSPKPQVAGSSPAAPARPRWWNRQTRHLEGVVGESPWEFKSPPRHDCQCVSRESCDFRGSYVSFEPKH